LSKYIFWDFIGRKRIRLQNRMLRKHWIQTCPNVLLLQHFTAFEQSQEHQRQILKIKANKEESNKPNIVWLISSWLNSVEQDSPGLCLHWISHALWPVNWFSFLQVKQKNRDKKSMLERKNEKHTRKV